MTSWMRSWVIVTLCSRLSRNWATLLSRPLVGGGGAFFGFALAALLFSLSVSPLSLCFRFRFHVARLFSCGSFFRFRFRFGFRFFRFARFFSRPSRLPPGSVFPCSAPTISAPQAAWLRNRESRLDRSVVGEAQGAVLERQLAPLGRPGGRRLDQLEAARQQVVDRPRTVRRGQPELDLASRAKTSGSSAGRRLRSPPKSSGASPAHSVAARAASRTSSVASFGRSLVACRLAMQTPEAVRVKAIERRSGSPSWIASSRRSAIPPRRPGTRTRVRFEPPSLEAIRSGFWRASSSRSGASELREVSARCHSAPQAAASGSAKRGGHSCSRATSQARRRAASRTRRSGRG